MEKQMGSHVERKVVNWKCIHNMWIELITKDDIKTYINHLALELDIYSLAHHLRKMWIFYEPRRVTFGNTRHFVEE